MVKVRVELRRRLWGREDLGTVEVPHEASDCHDQVVAALKGRVLMPGDTIRLRVEEAEDSAPTPAHAGRRPYGGAAVALVA